MWLRDIVPYIIPTMPPTGSTEASTQYTEYPTMTNHQGEKDWTPLFSNDDEGDAEIFRDEVRCLHEHFDKDGDGHLCFSELAALQKATEGVILSEEMYVMTCRALDCHPRNGISLGALKLTYASDGANVGG
jgi:hypothetical protein